MACEARCGEARFLGVAGECEAATGRCLCPPGYSGRDDWAEYNDCHVPERLQRVAWSVHLALHALCFVVGVAGVVWLAQHWNFVAPPPRRASRAASLSSAPSAAPNTPSTPGAGRERTQSIFRHTRASHYSQSRVTRETWRRQRDTILALVLLLLFSGFGLTYVVPYFFGIYRFDYVPFHSLALTVAGPSILVGLWTICYIWYRNLPNLRRYGELFEIRSVLIRFPNLVRVVTVVQILTIVLGSIGLLFVTPLVTDDVEVRQFCDTAWLWLACLFLVLFLVFFLALLAFLRTIFLQLRAVEREMRTPGDRPHAGTQNSLNTVRIMLGATITFAPIATALLAVMGLTEVGRENMWFFFNIVAIFGNCAALICYYVFVRRLAGPRVASRHPSLSAASVSSRAVADSPRTFRDRSARFPEVPSLELDKDAA